MPDAMEECPPTERPVRGMLAVGMPSWRCQLRGSLGWFVLGAVRGMGPSGGRVVAGDGGWTGSLAGCEGWTAVLEECCDVLCCVVRASSSAALEVFVMPTCRSALQGVRIRRRRRVRRKLQAKKARRSDMHVGRR